MSSFTLSTNRNSRSNGAWFRRRSPQTTKVIPFHNSKSDFPQTLSIGKSATEDAWTTVGKTTIIRSKRNQTVPTSAPLKSMTQVECAYCHNMGHHIKHCEKAANATARKQAKKRAERQSFQNRKRDQAVNLLRQQVQMGNPNMSFDAEASRILQSRNPFSTLTTPTESISGPDAGECKTGKHCRNDECNRCQTDTIEDEIERLNARKQTLTNWADIADLEDEIEKLEALRN